MISSLFGVFLSKAADAALGWGVGKCLDVITQCASCKERGESRVGNQQTNHFECVNCGTMTAQFTNACPSTIRPDTLQIAHASAGFTKEPFFWKTPWFSDSRFVIPYRIILHGLQQRTVRVDLAIRGQHGNHNASTVLSSRGAQSVHDLDLTLADGYLHHHFCDSHKCKVPNLSGVCDFTITVKTDTGEQLASHNRFVQACQTFQKCPQDWFLK